VGKFDMLDTLLTFPLPMVSLKKPLSASLRALEAGDSKGVAGGEGVDVGDGLLGGVRIILGAFRLMLKNPDMCHAWLKLVRMVR